MTEPRHAYIACTDTPERVRGNGFVHISHSVTLFLNPTEAIDTEKKFIGRGRSGAAGETIFIYLYQVDLTQLDGFWPRVSYDTYNDIELKWRCSYRGNLPVSALKHVNTVVTELDPSLSFL